MCVARGVAPVVHNNESIINLYAAVNELNGMYIAVWLGGGQLYIGIFSFGGKLCRLRG